MTDKQIRAIKDELHKKYYGDGCIKPNVKWSKKDEILDEELSCREMINSCLIYGYSCDEGGYSWERYLKPYYEGDTFHDGLLTKERVKELVKEQEEDIAKATIHVNVYTDGEGCTYNSITWADDMNF